MKQAKNEQTVCKRCVMDTTDPEITFDKNGYCNHCTNAKDILKSSVWGQKPNEKSKQLKKLIADIKSKGNGKKYDCIIGLSGGVDSSYCAYKVIELGLRPLAVHLDNGWNSELSVKNIENIVKKLDIDLFTYVIDWEEYRDLQMAFLKASTPDSEIITDHAIVSILHTVANREKIKYILPATNMSTESILPRSWSHGHSDWKYINSIHKMFGKVPLKTYPHRSMTRIALDKLISKIQYISFLDYLDYIKEDAMRILTDELGWRYYGGKHYESVYTRFFQGYILPTKFGFDKRKAHLSSLIISNQITRDDALKELENNVYPSKELLEDDMELFINKFCLSQKEFKKIMKTPPKTFWDYPSYENTISWNLIIMNGYRIYLAKKKY